MRGVFFFWLIQNGHDSCSRLPRRVLCTTYTGRKVLIICISAACFLRCSHESLSTLVKLTTRIRLELYNILLPTLYIHSSHSACIYNILCTRMLCVRAVEQVTATYMCVSFNIIIISYCSVVQTFIQGPYYTIVYTATQFRIYYVKVRVHYARIPTYFIMNDINVHIGTLNINIILLSQR